MRLSELRPDGATGPVVGGMPSWVGFLLRPTGKGDPASYHGHMLAYRPTDGWGRIARALTGAGGAIASAWPVDLIIGIVMVATGG